MQTKKSYVYIIADPADHIVRYVGKSDIPGLRLRQHIAEARKTSEGGSPFYQWLRAVLDVGRTPVMTAIDWMEWEEESERPRWCAACEQIQEAGNQWDQCDPCIQDRQRRWARNRQLEQQILDLERQWAEAYHQAGAPITNQFSSLYPKGESTEVRLRIPTRVYSAVWKRTLHTPLTCEAFMRGAVRHYLTHCARQERRRRQYKTDAQLTLWKGGKSQ